MSDAPPPKRHRKCKELKDKEKDGEKTNNNEVQKDPPNKNPNKTVSEPMAMSVDDWSEFEGIEIPETAPERSKANVLSTFLTLAQIACFTGAVKSISFRGRIEFIQKEVIEGVSENVTTGAPKKWLKRSILVSEEEPQLPLDDANDRWSLKVTFWNDHVSKLTSLGPVNYGQVIELTNIRIGTVKPGYESYNWGTIEVEGHSLDQTSIISTSISLNPSFLHFSKLNSTFENNSIVCLRGMVIALIDSPNQTEILIQSKDGRATIIWREKDALATNMVEKGQVWAFAGVFVRKAGLTLTNQPLYEYFDRTNPNTVLLKIERSK